MTRAQAIELLFWFHDREKWYQFYGKRRWLVEMPFPRPRPVLRWWQI